MTDWPVWTASPADLDRAAALEASAFGEHSWGKDSFKESFVASGATTILGGIRKSEALGFALWRTFGEEAEILAIGVAPAARRSGLGAALLAALIAEARKSGAQTLFLEVAAGNEAAMAIYDAAGFRQSGVRRGYYRSGEDALSLQLQL